MLLKIYSGSDLAHLPFDVSRVTMNTDFLRTSCGFLMHLVTSLKESQFGTTTNLHNLSGKNDLNQKSLGEMKINNDVKS